MSELVKWTEGCEGCCTATDVGMPEHEPYIVHVHPECPVHGQPAPIDWPARFRAAAEVAEGEGWLGTATQLRELALHFPAGRPAGVEAIGRALLGEES